MKKRFYYAEGKRNEITRNQNRQIKSFYKQIVEEIKKEIEYFNGKDDSSNASKRVYLNNLSQIIKEKVINVDVKTERLISTNIDYMLQAVLENNEMFLKGIGFTDYYNNPQLRIDMANQIMSGKLYDNKWNLSSAIWGDDKSKLDEINKIVSSGILKGRSTYEIAKDLEKYVNPSVSKGTYWNTMYPGVRTKIDYNAQRLARTMIQHSYQESFVRMTKDNPFIVGYKWITSGGPNVCAICIAREEDDEYGMGPGVFPKDKLPLDHPNGMCTFEVVTNYSDEEISQALADWYEGVGDELMNRNIDKFIIGLK